jgi:hypothetical protein
LFWEDVAVKVFGKPMTKYGVTIQEVEAFCKDLLVKDWLGKYGGGRIDRARGLCRYFKWLRVVKNLNYSPKTLLNEQIQLRQSNNIEDRQRHLRLALAHTRDNPDLAQYSDRRKYAVFSWIKNFYDHHEVPLTTGKKVFGRYRKLKNHPKQMSMARAVEILGLLPQRERTILLLILQSGMEIGRVLNVFNYMWDDVLPLVRAKAERIKIEFVDRKNNPYPYFTYISRDAIQELRKWLTIRKKILAHLNEKDVVIDPDTLMKKPIFITEDGTPYKPLNFYGIFKYHLRKARIPRGQHKLVSHMFRKLFRTEASPPERAIDQRIVEFFMGHINGIQAVGGDYDKSPELYESMFEREYAKLEPYINPYSGAVERGVQDRKLEKEIEELKQIVETLVERSEEWKEKLRE